VRERRSYKQEAENGSSQVGGPIIGSPAAADRAHSDLAAALAEIAAIFRAASDSIAAGAAEACRAKSFATTIEVRTRHDGSLGRRYRDQCRIAGTNFSRAQALVCRRRK
jgi:hypothetical protein